MQGLKPIMTEFDITLTRIRRDLSRLEKLVNILKSQIAKPSENHSFLDSSKAIGDEELIEELLEENQIEYSNSKKSFCDFYRDFSIPITIGSLIIILIIYLFLLFFSPPSNSINLIDNNYNQYRPPYKLNIDKEKLNEILKTLKEENKKFLLEKK